MDRAFIRFGHGYESGSRGRCEAFDGFEIIAAPLGEWSEADRESRIFRRPGGGTDYSSHAIKLAKDGGNLYILMQHGAGREVLRVPTFFDGGELERHILNLPAPLQYALLYTIWSAARNARQEALREESGKWREAAAFKRIRTRTYPKRGTVKVWIEPAREEGESEENYSLRKRFAAP